MLLSKQPKPVNLDPTMCQTPAISFNFRSFKDSARIAQLVHFRQMLDKTPKKWFTLSDLPMVHLLRSKKLRRLKYALIPAD
jgi:hypothetical protein